MRREREGDVKDDGVASSVIWRGRGVGRNRKKASAIPSLPQPPMAHFWDSYVPLELKVNSHGRFQNAMKRIYPTLVIAPTYIEVW